MAKKVRGVWGIDIGQTAIKALRCQLSDNGEVVADSFDFVEYPKILSMPDADEEALVAEALETFLSRNDIRGDYVGITVSGQAGLSRFFKPPPVDARTLPDIVKYEVRQQIPFPIDDVIWDWQTMGGTEMDGHLVDSEVGLFAVKRDTIFTVLKPFLDKNIEVDLVQLSPIATYNVICREVLGEIPEGTDPETLTDYLVIMSISTDATDLIVTNGVRLWLRNIPIGGNHFTKELSRELKLTHAKAEQLKRNARLAEDPKTVFQAMRRIFNDLKREVERSLSYFSGIEKHAKLQRIVLLGNSVQLPGLRQFLNKQLEMDIVKLSEFSKLEGQVVNEKAFQENLLSFAPAYGLCLQGLRKSSLKTNLLPQEFVNERIVRAKKPWVLASVSLLMLGMLFSYFFVNQGWWRVNENYSAGGSSWKKAMEDAAQKANISKTWVDLDADQFDTLRQLNSISGELVEAVDKRANWAEILSAISQVLPRDEKMLDENGNPLLFVDSDAVPFMDRNEVYLEHIETEFKEDISTWLANALSPYLEQQGERDKLKSELEKKAKGSSSGGFAYRNKKNDGKQSVSVAGEYSLSGPGWVIELKGYHFSNSREKLEKSVSEIKFVLDEVINRFIHQTVRLPNSNGVMEDYKLEDVGLYFPTIVSKRDALPTKYRISNPKFGRTGKDKDEKGPPPGEGAADPKGGDGKAGDDRSGPPAEGDGDGAEPPAGGEEKQDEQSFLVDRYDFTIQLGCIPVSPKQRDENKAARLKAEEEAAKQAASQPAAPGDNVDNGESGDGAEPAEQPPAGEQPSEDVPGDAAAEGDKEENAPESGDATDPPAGDSGDSGENPGDNNDPPEGDNGGGGG
jgi:type IV pilus assembly protein PilM